MDTPAPSEIAATGREAEELREDLEAVTSHVRMLLEQQDASLRREDALRAEVKAAREQALRREEDLRREAADRERRWEEERAAHRAALAEAGERERRLHEQLAGLHDQLARQAHDIHLLRADRDALQARLDRLRRSIPGRVYAGVRSLAGRVLRLTAFARAGRPS